MVARFIFKPVKSLSFVAVLSLAAIDILATVHAANASRAKHAEAERSLTGPAVMAIVSLDDQRISVYDAQGSAMRARVSSGQTDYETPVGIYSILQKNEEHYSNLYDDASMPFMQRLTWSGIALHAGVLPGYPASHGCVRMPHGYSEQIFQLSKLGMRVIVARNNVAPAEITHPLLFKPIIPAGKQQTTQVVYEPEGETVEGSPFEPVVRNWPARQAQLDVLRSVAAAKSTGAEPATERADALKKIETTKSAERAKTIKALQRAESAKRKADERVAKAARWAASAKSASDKKSAEENLARWTAAAAQEDAKVAAAKTLDQAAEQELASATAAFTSADAVKTAAVAEAQDAKRKTLPVSVFVSLKTQRLYVRQGHDPVFDVPVTIAEPEQPIGTHIFTAVDYADEGNDVKWMAVSIGPHSSIEADASAERKHRSSKASSVPSPTDLAGATAALDRVSIPADVVARLSEFVWPGSSLIISDEEASKETGKATDFVVLISGEPQGGIKKRRRQSPPDYYRYYYNDYYYYEHRARRTPRYTPSFSFW